MEKIKLSPPWVEFVREIQALFEKDPDIKMDYDEDNMDLRFFVSDSGKYEALINLLPEHKMFGNVPLKITIVPSNTESHDARYYMKKLFAGNKSVTDIQDVTGVTTNPMTFIVFEKKVVQFWNDNLGDLNGMKSTIMEQVARDVFGSMDGVFFCTDTGDE